MKATRRKSRQREKIYELMASAKEHFTAQEVYDRLKGEMPSLSLGNVYRNIGILLEERRIHGSEFGNGTVRYDAVTDGHYHFVCDACGGVSDLTLPVQDSITAAAGTCSPHTIRGHTIRFFGLCAACAKKERSARKAIPAKSKQRR